MGSSHELVEAFTEAVPAALSELAGVQVVVCEDGPGDTSDDYADLMAVIRLTMAGGEGRLELCLPDRTATELARRVLAGTVDCVTPDLVCDCMGEVANVVAGHAKALLVGRPSHFKLSTPVAHAGRRVKGTAGWVIRFDSEVGKFNVRLVSPA